MTDDAHGFVRDLYDEYGGAFSGLDADASTHYWHAPSIRTGPREVRLDATDAERRAGFVDAIDDLRPTDYDHSESVAMTSRRLSDSLALTCVVWERLTTAGEVMARFSPIHLLRRTDDGWRFLARATRRSTDPLELREADPAEPSAPESIESAVEEYAGALATGDADAIARHWTLPTLVVSPERVRAVTTPEEAAPLVEEGALAEGGDVVRVHAHESDDAVAVADVVWDRDGGRVATFHLLHETDGRWRVLLTARHPAGTAVLLEN